MHSAGTGSLVPAYFIAPDTFVMFHDKVLLIGPAAVVDERFG